MSRILVAALILLVDLSHADAEEPFAVEPLPDPPLQALMEVRARPDDIVDGAPSWRDRLLALFDETVLHNEAKRPRGVNKWTGPIDLSLRGDAADDVAPYVETVAAELSVLIGQPIELYVDQNWAGDIDIYITYWKNYWPFFMEAADPNNRIFTCAVLPFADRGRIKRATIKINAGVLDPSTARACLLEELTQALGLFGETEAETQTILHDGIGYLALGEIDRLLIQILYDKRLTPGMPGEAALPVAEMVIDSWLSARDFSN